eukprot:6038872-Prymnesium_polylepis.1
MPPVPSATLSPLAQPLFPSAASVARVALGARLAVVLRQHCRPVTARAHQPLDALVAAAAERRGVYRG